MQPLTPESLKKCFVNTSKREAAEAIPPFRLNEVEWDKLDVFGWTDKSNPLAAYLVIPVDNVPVGIMLRAPEVKPKKTLCAMCEDVLDLEDVKLFVAKFAGAAGRRGDTVGTLIHSDFSCSKHVRRRPSKFEGITDHDAYIARRISLLQEHSVKFARRVLNADEDA